VMTSSSSTIRISAALNASHSYSSGRSKRKYKPSFSGASRF
jgi:hypothetical protein